MITLVGVGHVFQISAQVRRVIHERRAGAVCIELDPRRYRALLADRKGREGPLTYRILSIFQRRLARQFGGEVGAEMISAVEAAREVGADTLLIDVDAGALFDRLWKEMPLNEKIRLMISSVISLFASKERVERDLQDFQENEEMYLGAFSQHFPTLKKVLIDDRNRIMAARIGVADDQYGNVVAVIGDGHVEGIRSLLEGHEVRVTRLRELRAMSPLSDEDLKGAGEASFSFTTHLEE